MSEVMLDLDAVVAASDKQVSSELAGESVILDLESGTYFGLDVIGSRIWELIQEPKTIAEVCDQLMGEYDVRRERCETEVLDLLEEMKAQGLVYVR